ncbi:MAG: Hsp70 family protein, partial [Desulfobacterales bacterium]|nr:Hsp70 family protein [Desulfobacterales bacterium]
LHLNMVINRNTFESLSAPILDQIRKVLRDTFQSTGLQPDWVSSVVLVGGSSRIPCVKQLLSEELASHTVFRQDLNPEEIVAIGAGLLAGSMEGYYPDVHFKDVVSHDLGVEDDNGEFITLIERGTVYPLQADRLFTTTQDDQTKVTVHIQQKDELLDEVISLGQFIVDDIPAMPSGEPDIRVSFSIDSNGILRVRAVEEISGIQHEIQVKSNLIKDIHNEAFSRSTDESKPVAQKTTEEMCK